MLALPDVEGTTAVRTDINKNYILSQADASILSNWVQLATPDASIQSVNGQTGTVLLTKADLSLANATPAMLINRFRAQPPKQLT
jgi:hypothetical protein